MLSINSTKTYIKNKAISNFSRIAACRTNHNESYTRYTTAFNFSLLCGAQAIAFSQNKKIDKDSKKFLISSEIIEGLMKIAIFMLLSKGFGTVGQKFVKHGFLIPECISKKLGSIKTREGAKKLISKILHESKNCTDGTKVPSLNSKKDYESFKKFYKGVGMVSNIIGMIIGLSIFVPIVRNFIAKTVKDKILDKKQNNINAPKPDQKVNNSNKKDLIYYTGENKAFDKFVLSNPKPKN